MSRPYPVDDSCYVCGEVVCTCPTIEEIDDFFRTRREEIEHDERNYTD